MLTDRRSISKTINIVTETNNVQRYSWRWNEKAAEIGLSGNASGVIAQEVRQVLPEAVSTLNGYLAVDYAQILEAQ